MASDEHENLMHYYIKNKKIIIIFIRPMTLITISKKLKYTKIMKTKKMTEVITKIINTMIMNTNNNALTFDLTHILIKDLTVI